MTGGRELKQIIKSAYDPRAAPGISDDRPDAKVVGGTTARPKGTAPPDAAAKRRRATAPTSSRAGRSLLLKSGEDATL